MFETVQARLAANIPKITPPRAVNGPTLLTGLAVCTSCGAGLTRTGTNRHHRTHSYYSCAGCQQKGKSVCAGRHIPMAKLGNLVAANLNERLFTPDRLAVILKSLAARQGAKDRRSRSVAQRFRVSLLPSRTSWFVSIAPGGKSLIFVYQPCLQSAIVGTTGAGDGRPKRCRRAACQRERHDHEERQRPVRASGRQHRKPHFGIFGRQKTFPRFPIMETFG